MMKDFMEKWQNEPKFKTKVKLGLYTLFVVLVALFALLNRQPVDSNEFTNTYKDYENIFNKVSVDIPEEYEYTIDIKINNDYYQYKGIKEKNKETIIKVKEDNTTNYIYEQNNYYKEENDTYIITTKEEVYDIVDYNYLKLETINQYLSKSTKEKENNLIYLKDIILGYDGEEYIIINVNQNKINIDYTSLMKLFDGNIESYLININIDEKE